MARHAPGMADAHEKLHALSPRARHAEGAEIGTGQEGRAAGPCDRAAAGGRAASEARLAVVPAGGGRCRRVGYCPAHMCGGPRAGGPHGPPQRRNPARAAARRRQTE